MHDARGCWHRRARESRESIPRRSRSSSCSPCGIPFFEAHVAVSLEVAEQRDTKGLYRRARAGEIADFTGIHQPYEEPLAPELLLESADSTIAQCVEQVLAHLQSAARS